MEKRVLKLKELDNKTVAHALEKFYGNRLNNEQVQRIYDNGIEIFFEGNAPFAKSLDYFLFSNGVSKNKLERVKVRCHFSKSNHPDIVKGDPDNALVGGTLTNGRFAGFSSTWLKDANNRSPAYDLGDSINEIMLTYFNIPK